jgi:RNA polymerase sigma factor for flagellar operon FliA
LPQPRFRQKSEFGRLAQCDEECDEEEAMETVVRTSKSRVPGEEGKAASGYPVSLRAQMLNGDQERILLEHLPIVRFLARRIHERLPQHVDIEDLVSAGVVGLMDAFVKFDPAKKVQFRSYAQFRIRGAILDSLRTLDWSPRELRRKGRAVEEAIRRLMSRLGRVPGEHEIASELDLQLEEYQQLLGELKGLEIGTLHMERNEDSGEDELAYVPGRPEEDPLFRCLRGELEDRLTGAIAHLAERERLVLTLYYYEEMTMREIGAALGVVESRISQIHTSAVMHLRAALAGTPPQRGMGKCTSGSMAYPQERANWRDSKKQETGNGKANGNGRETQPE